MKQKPKTKNQRKNDKRNKKMVQELWEGSQKLPAPIRSMSTSPVCFCIPKKKLCVSATVFLNVRQIGNSRGTVLQRFYAGFGNLLFRGFIHRFSSFLSFFHKFCWFCFLFSLFKFIIIFRCLNIFIFLTFFEFRTF